MSCLLLLPVLLLSGFDVGGRVGAAFPGGGLATFHGPPALFGGNVGYSAGRSRFELGYTFAGLPGRQASAYHMDIHEATLTYGYEFLRRPSWGFEATVGPGYGLARRSFLSGAETGKAPSGHLGLGFVQHQGPSRLSLGLDNAVFIESAESGTTSRVALTYLFSIHAGVAYAF
jgi:hypothetical protein